MVVIFSPLLRRSINDIHEPSSSSALPFLTFLRFSTLHSENHTQQTEATVRLPTSLTLASKAVEKRRLPSFGAETMLLDYCEQVRSQVMTPWGKRRELVGICVCM